MASYEPAAATELPDTIDGLLWRMRGELTCPICLQMLTEAKSTPCGHSFCFTCIKKALQSSNKCPVCKQTATPRGLLDADSLNLIVQDFLELREVYEKETGHDLSLPAPMRTWRTDPIPDLSQQIPYPTKSGPAQGTSDPEEPSVTSLEIRQANERQQQETPDEYVIACTSVQDNNVLEHLAHLIRRHANIRKVPEMSEEVTCVVVATDDRRLAQHRTIKYLQAVLMGKMIVSQDWISACYEEGQTVPTDRYEVVGDPVGVLNGAENTPQRARQHIASGGKLFKDQVFWFYGVFTRPTQDELSSLVTLGGGRIEASGDALPAAGNIICSSRLTTTEAGRLFARYHKKPVACAWILDCISAYEVLRKDKYVAGDVKNSRYVYGRPKHGA